MNKIDLSDNHGNGPLMLGGTTYMYSNPSVLQPSILGPPILVPKCKFMYYGTFILRPPAI